jgi:hypothetical protein
MPQFAIRSAARTGCAWSHGKPCVKKPGPLITFAPSPVAHLDAAAMPASINRGDERRTGGSPAGRAALRVGSGAAVCQLAARQPRVARGGSLLAGLRDAAADHLLTTSRVDAGALDHGLYRAAARG